MEWELCSWAQRKALCPLGLQALSWGVAGEMGHSGPPPSFPSPLAVEGEERCAPHSMYRRAKPQCRPLPPPAISSLPDQRYHLGRAGEGRGQVGFFFENHVCEGPQDGLGLSQYRGTCRATESCHGSFLGYILITKMALHKPSIDPSN